MPAWVCSANQRRNKMKYISKNILQIIQIPVLFALILGFSGAVYSSSLDLARCVNVSNKAASLMRSVGNTEQQRNFLKFSEGFTLAGNKLYGNDFFRNLNATRSAVNVMTEQDLVEILPKCIELGNSLNAQMGSAAVTASAKNVVPFSVINKSSQQIIEIYASPSSNDKWGRDLLGDKYIDLGREYSISPSVQDVCIQDVRVVFKDKSEYESSKKDLCSNQSFTLTDNSRKHKTQTQEPVSRTYCAVSSMGGPPVGCGLTLQVCQDVVRGLAGMLCR